MLSALKRLRDQAAAQLCLVLEPPPRDPAGMLTRLRALGLRRTQRVTLTRNRNVMVSFRGDELRLHEGYLAAPEDVLRAIVAFVEGRTRAERARGKRHLLTFQVAQPERRVPHRARERTHPDDEGLSERLTEWHGRYNAERFGGELRALRVRVSRRMRSRLGHYSPASRDGDAPEIAISRRHLRRHGWDEALETLLHEMVHQWQDERGLPIDHGRGFRAKARELGIAPNARRAVTD